MFEDRGNQSLPPRQGRTLLNTANIPHGISEDFSPSKVGNGIREAIFRAKAAAREKEGNEVHLQHPDHKRAIELGVSWVKSLVARASTAGAPVGCTPLVAHEFPDGSREILLSLDRDFFWHTLRPVLKDGVRTLTLTRHVNPSFFLLEILAGAESRVTFSQVLSLEEFRSLQAEFKALESVFRDYGQNSYPLNWMDEVSWVCSFLSEAVVSAIEEANKRGPVASVTATNIKSLTVKSESSNSIDVSFVVAGPDRTEHSEGSSFEMVVDFRISHRKNGELQSVLTSIKI